MRFFNAIKAAYAEFKRAWNDRLTTQGGPSNPKPPPRAQVAGGPSHPTTPPRAE